MKAFQFVGKSNFFIVLFFLLIVSPIKLQAQSNSFDSTFRQLFNTFSDSITQDFESFRQKNDSIFIGFLSQAWKEFQGVKVEMPKTPKPLKQPVFEKTGTKNTGTSGKNDGNSGIPEKTDFTPAKAGTSIFPVSPAFSFYGAAIPAITNKSKLPQLKEVSEHAITLFFIDCQHSADVISIAKNLKGKAEAWKLNDWGLFSLTMKKAKQLFASKNEQVLFTWYGLLFNGLNVKVGYSEKNIYLIVPANVLLYTTRYTVDSKEFYVLDLDKLVAEPDKIKIYEGFYPGNRPDFSLLFSDTPELEFLMTKKKFKYINPLRIYLNQYLLEFYHEYPACELKVYFKAPLTRNLINQLDKFFVPLLEGKNDDQRVAFLLDYVQKSISYITDQEQFGCEKYLFTDETLFYGAADCEDRSILLAHLIKHYTSLQTIGLAYPGHVSLAVNLKKQKDGNYVMYKNQRFYCCDPTYINSDCGDLMTSLVGITPSIID